MKPFHLPFLGTLVAVLLLGAGLAPAVWAHSFAVLIIPDPQAGTRNTFDGFRLATRERDGHADEESDGHLGGLDVYISMVEEGASLVESLSTARFDMVVVTGGLARDTDIRSTVQARGAVLVPVPALTRKMTDQFLGAYLGGTFAQRFDAAFGRTALQPATLAYVAARMIDLAVRAQEGTGDQDALGAVLSEF